MNPSQTKLACRQSQQPGCYSKARSRHVYFYHVTISSTTCFAPILMLSPAVMFSLLSTGPGGVHHIALDVQCHESPVATHSTGLDSSSDSVYSVEGHTLHHLTNTHICQEALSKGLATQTCALEDGLPDGHTQQHVLASNTACSLHSFGGRHTTSTPGWAFDQVRPHIERMPRKQHTKTHRPHKLPYHSTTSAHT